jgi:hypothetical protein
MIFLTTGLILELQRKSGSISRYGYRFTSLTTRRRFFQRRQLHRFSAHHTAVLHQAKARAAEQHDKGHDHGKQSVWSVLNHEWAIGYWLLAIGYWLLAIGYWNNTFTDKWFTAFYNSFKQSASLRSRLLSQDQPPRRVLCQFVQSGCDQDLAGLLSTPQCLRHH